MKKLLMLTVLAGVGLVGGAGAGWLLKPPAPAPCLDGEGQELSAEACAEEAADKAALYPATVDERYGSPSEFVPMDRQFVIPVMGPEKVEAMVLVSLTVEVDPGSTDQVISRQPRVRDAFLRVLFDHAYSGGFDGEFTAEYVLGDLRRSLLKAARVTAGPQVRDVLVADVIRQEQ